MQLGIRVHDTTKRPFEERIKEIHDLGFACGHLALGKVIEEYSTADEAMTPGFAMYVKNVFAKNNVDIAVPGMLSEPGKSESGAACKDSSPLYGAYPFCFSSGLRRCRNRNRCA